jgi:hypothetical protein
MQKQVPFGDDNKKDKCKCKGNSKSNNKSNRRSPSGMTTRKAMGMTTREASATMSDSVDVAVIAVIFF